MKFFDHFLRVLRPAATLLVAGLDACRIVSSQKLKDRPHVYALPNYVIAIVLLVFSLGVGAAPQPYCGGAEPDSIDIALEQDLAKAEGVTVDLREAQQRAYMAWNIRLDAAYRTLQSKVSEADRKLLVQSQLEWRKFYETHFDFVWSQSMFGRGASFETLVAGDWSRDMLKTRVCALESAVNYLDANGR